MKKKFHRQVFVFKATNEFFFSILPKIQMSSFKKKKTFTATFTYVLIRNWNLFECLIKINCWFVAFYRKKRMINFFRLIKISLCQSQKLYSKFKKFFRALQTSKMLFEFQLSFKELLFKILLLSIHHSNVWKANKNFLIADYKVTWFSNYSQQKSYQKLWASVNRKIKPISPYK